MKKVHSFTSLRASNHRPVFPFLANFDGCVPLSQPPETINNILQSSNDSSVALEVQTDSPPPAKSHSPHRSPTLLKINFTSFAFRERGNARMSHFQEPKISYFLLTLPPNT